MPPPAALIQIVLDLLAEKERLIHEKDELVESKNKIWREYYNLIQEKEREIGVLRQEVRELTSEVDKAKGRSRELERALRDLLDKEDDSEGDDTEGQEEQVEQEEQGAQLAQVKQQGAVDDAAIRKYSVSADDLPMAQNAVGLEGYLPDAEPPPPAAQPPRAIKQTPSGKLSTATKLAMAAPIVPKKEPRPPKLDPDAFTFGPLIRVTQNREDECGEIANVASAVLKSIRATMGELARRGHPAPYESTCCAWRYIEGHRSQAPWSLDAPRRHACRACFNARRACLLWLGEMKWMVLPLPPQTRTRQVTWRHVAYYIYQGKEDSTAFPGVWRESRQEKRKRKRADTDD